MVLYCISKYAVARWNLWFCSMAVYCSIHSEIQLCVICSSLCCFITWFTYLLTCVDAGSTSGSSKVRRDVQRPNVASIQTVDVVPDVGQCQSVWCRNVVLCFLPRDAMRCISAVFAVMQCLSVCPSVTFVDHVKTNKRIFEIFSPSGSDTILVFRFAWLPERHPQGKQKMKAGVRKLTIFLQLWFK